MELSKAQMENTQVIEVELRVQLSALLVYWISAWCFISFILRVARHVMIIRALLPRHSSIVCILTTTIRLISTIRLVWFLVVIEENLNGFVVLTTVQGYISTQMSQEALRLLTSELSDALVELSSITLQTVFILIGAFEALLCTLIIALQQFELGFVRI